MSDLEVSAEKYIIGCMVKDYAYTRSLAGNIGLESKHFESKTSRTLWEIAETLYGKGIDIDAASVIEGIEQTGQHLDAKAASTLVLSAMTIATSTQSLPLHMNTVMEKATIRSAKSTFKAAESSLDNGEDLDMTLASVKHRLARIGHNIKESVTIGERLKGMANRYKTVRTQGCSGIKSRWAHIQRYTAGYPFGKITVLGARPKMGKSTLALNEAVYTAMAEKVPTVCFSLEMDQDELLEKAGSDIAEVDNMRLKLGTMSSEEIDDFMHKGPETVSKAPLYVEDKPGQTVEQICAKIREYANERGVRFVIIDYLQIISSSPGKKFQSRTYEIQNMTNEIRIAAKETGVAVLLLSQISRPLKSYENAGALDPMPKMSDLKDSGAIEQDAYIIMFIGHCTISVESAPSWMHPGIDPVTIRVDANRGGRTGEVHMRFNKPFNKFLSDTEFLNYKLSCQESA